MALLAVPGGRPGHGGRPRRRRRIRQHPRPDRQRRPGAGAEQLGRCGDRDRGTSYYEALTRGDARSAYGLLCRGQQSVGYAQYASEVSTNETTGTGIVGWQPTSATVVLGNAAQTAGLVTLTGGVSTPIVVQSVLETAGWRVCSSNLGGVLPAPGTAAAGPAPTTSASGSSA